MGLTLAKCPACGADLNLETDRDFFYCPHCGSKVLKDADRIVIEHVTRTIDEAKIKEVELEHKKFEIDEVFSKKMVAIIMVLLFVPLATFTKSTVIIVISLVGAALLIYKIIKGLK